MMSVTMSRFALALFAAAMLAGTSAPAGATSDAGGDMDAGMAMGGGMHSRPDGRAPAGVMGDHVLMKGAWSVAYPTMRMEMDGNRSGTDRLSDAEVLAAFPVAATRMTMDMHMLSAMYGLSEALSFMVMAPYIDISMEHVTRTGVRFTTESSGFGDVSLSGVYRLFQSAGHEVLLNAGVSLPSGSIDERDDTPAGANQQLPYPMQLGSGTFDLLPGLTYRGHAADLSWGGQLGGTVRLGHNDNGYSLGDRYRATVWGARRWADWISTSLRVNGESIGNIDGADPLLVPAMVATADPGRRGGARVDLLAGINLAGTQGVLEGLRVFAEFGMPIYQNLDGPQLETDWVLNIGVQIRF